DGVAHAARAGPGAHRRAARGLRPGPLVGRVGRAPAAGKLGARAAGPPQRDRPDPLRRDHPRVVVTGPSAPPTLNPRPSDPAHTRRQSVNHRRLGGILAVGAATLVALAPMAAAHVTVNPGG